jgi:uncharacterized protein YecE (DUF72 family)
MKNIFIGTSGWYYEHWIKTFYPEGTDKKDFLEFYQKKFSSVEINNSFYHLPRGNTFINWKDKVPHNFVFAVKASRYITHIKRMLNAGEGFSKFLTAAEDLGEKLGPILFQLPPKWHCDPDRLSSFLDILPNTHKFAFELRDHSWLNDEIYALLKSHNCAFCIYELNGFVSPKIITADHVYIRLHGPGSAYQGSYDQATLREWAQFILSMQKEGKKVYCYFDNDQSGYAAHNAMAISEIIG